MKRQKRNSDTKFSSIRIRSSVMDSIEKILKEANKKDFGKKVKAEEVLMLLLEKLHPEDIQELQKRSMTNKNRRDRLLQKYIEVHGPTTEEEFIGFTLTSEYAIFLEEHKTTLLSA